MRNRSAVKAKIKALRGKTKARGCTEAEALAAAEMAARLMAEAGLSEDELKMTEAEAFERTVRATWRADLVGLIAHVTSTAPIVTAAPSGAGSLHLFIGEDPRPEIAVYLRDVLFRAVESEIRSFKETPLYRRRRTLTTKRAAVRDFVDGLLGRLRGRLREMFRATMNQTALEKAKCALALRFPSTQRFGRPDRDARFVDAREAGWQAGGAIALHHGVAGGAAPKLIGGARG